MRLFWLFQAVCLCVHPLVAILRAQVTFLLCRTVKSARCLINYGLFKEMKNLGGNNPPVSAKSNGLCNATSLIEP